MLTNAIVIKMLNKILVKIREGKKLSKVEINLLSSLITLSISDLQGGTDDK